MSDIAIASTDINDWRGPSSGVELWLSLDVPITTPEGQAYGAHPLTIRRVACSVAVVTLDGLQQQVLTIPAIALPATENAIVGNTARYSAVFYKGKASIGPWQGFDSFTLPSAPDSTTWAIIRAANNAGVARFEDQATFTRREILSIINQYLGVRGGDYVAVSAGPYNWASGVGFIDVNAAAGPVSIIMGTSEQLPVQIRKSPNDATFNAVTITYGTNALVLNLTGQSAMFVPFGGGWILWQRSF